MHIHHISKDIPQSRRRIIRTLILRQLGGKNDFVRQNPDFLVRLDDGELDVEGCYFVGQGIAVAFQCKGSRGVHGHSGRADVAAYAGEDHDVAIVSVAEEGERRADEVNLAEVHGFELVADEVLCCGGGGEFFDRADDRYSKY